MNLRSTSVSPFTSFTSVWQATQARLRRIFDRSGDRNRPTSQARLRQSRKLTCLFCNTDNRELNRIIDDNKTFYIRLDNFPAADGHMEIVPKRHVVSFFELTRREVLDAYDLITAARDEIIKRTGEAHGYTIGVNEGEAAGRTVDHLHIHIIARRYGDVKDPRGGIRQIFPNNNPDAWAPNGSKTPSPILIGIGSRRAQ